MLSKTLVPLAFGQGLDTKRDKKQQVYGTLRIAENVVFETLDSARKRNGYDSITLVDTNDEEVIAKYLASFKNELLVFDSNNLYGYSQALGKLEDRGTVYSIFPTSWPVVNNGYNISQVDMCLANDLKFFVYVSNGTVRYSVQDNVSQTMLVSDEQIAAAGSHPKVVAIGNKVFIFYANSTNIYYKTCLTTNPSSIVNPVPTLYASNLNSSNSIFDVVVANNKMLVAYHTTNTLARLYINTLSESGAIGTPKQIPESSQLTALDVFVDSSSRLVVTYATSAAVKYFVANSTPVILPAFYVGSTITPITIDSVSNVVSLISCEVTYNSYNVYYTISAANSYDYRIKESNITDTGAVVTPDEFLRSVALASKPFKVNGQNYFLASYSSATQPTYFVVDTHKAVVSKINSGIAGGLINANVMPAIYADQTYAIIPTLYRTKIVAENGDFLALNGVTNTKLDFSNANSYQNAVLGNNMIIGGGIVQAYDGELIVEHGFNVYPEKPVLTALTSGTADNYTSLSMANSASALDVYTYCVVYKWVDHQGQEHRSAASEEVQIHLASGSSQIGVQVVAPTLRLTQKTNVMIEIYRTELNGTIFYLANDPTKPLVNSTTANTVTFIDGKPDSALISGRALYTTGGILDNIPAPSAKVVATHTASQRIFLAGLENENVLQYSKIVFPGQPVEFNDALVIPVDPIGGKITALASMDEKLIIFEQDAVLFISGNGPNNAGQQDSFTVPERISTDVGCIDPKSVVLTPDGLMFKSRKGIYLLSRALQLGYIGAPVEAYNELTITSAKVVGELNQVRFTTNDGDTLVYNYVFKFWATFTNHKAQSSEVINNDYYYLRMNGELYKENRTSYSDAGTTIKMRVEIGWISFAVLQGFSRIYKMLILGDWYSKHLLKVQVAYDFKDAYLQSVIMDPELAKINASTYGQDSPYGEVTGIPYGGTGDAYQVRINFKQQKCQSIKLLIEDEQENAGQGFSLSQITFEVGGKAGLFKLAKGKKFAMS